MDKEPSTYGLSPEGLAKILGVGVDAEKLDPEERAIRSKAELLEAMLSGMLPPDSATADALPAIVGRLCREVLPLEGRTLGEVLLDSTAKLEVIKKIKDHGKRLAARKRDETEHAASVAIYFGAIASALLFHDAKITQHSYKNLASSFGMLIDKPWVPSDLARHLSKARKACEKRTP